MVAATMMDPPETSVEIAGEKEAREAVALNVAARRLENLIHDRRIALAAQHTQTRPEAAVP
jgi:hypothetical protein